MSSPRTSGRTRDPIRRALPGVSDADPPKEELLKGAAKESGAAPVAGPRTFGDALRRGPVGFVRLLGPGVVTGASDDDPSGIGTYSQVGSQFGYGLLWTALLTLPLMIAVQEMCARIGLHTRVGLGASLRRRFPTPLVGAAVIALVIANTINVGADLGAIASGAGLLVGHVPNVVYVIGAAVLVLGFQLFSSYDRLSSIFKWLDAGTLRVCDHALLRASRRRAAAHGCRGSARRLQLGVARGCRSDPWNDHLPISLLLAGVIRGRRAAL